jgi:hypothetical protein
MCVKGVRMGKVTDIPRNMGLSESPLCRRCVAEDETSAHILCECETLVSLRHAYLDSFFLEPEDVKIISMGPSGTLTK